MAKKKESKPISLLRPFLPFEAGRNVVPSIWDNQEYPYYWETTTDYEGISLGGKNVEEPEEKEPLPTPTPFKAVRKKTANKNKEGGDS